LIWLNEVSLAKTLVLWKLLCASLPINLEVKKSGFMLCVIIILNLCLICSFIIILSYDYGNG